MDPVNIVTLSSGITAVIGRLFTTGKAIKDLRDKWKDAPATLRLLQSECRAVGSILHILRLECEKRKRATSLDDDTAIPLEFIENDIEATGDTLRDLEDWLSKLREEAGTGKAMASKRNAIRAIWDEGRIDVMLKHLDIHKSSLNLHISAFQM